MFSLLRYIPINFPECQNFDSDFSYYIYNILSYVCARRVLLISLIAPDGRVINLLAMRDVTGRFA